MAYWTNTMQDDVYMIVVDGWKANTDLIPSTLIVKHYFSTDQEGIQVSEGEREDIQQQMLELDEEHGGEGGYLEEAKNDKGKITKAGIIARLRDVNLDPEADEEERQTLDNYLGLIDKESETKRKIRETQRELDAKVTARYDMLNEDEIKTLVIDDKWLAGLEADLQREMDRVSQTLSGRVGELADRYLSPLPQLTSEIDILASKVNAHLEIMGFIWN